MNCTNFESYIHTYILTYLHTYIHTYLHTYMLTCLHAYILTYLHTYILTYLHTYILKLKYRSHMNDLLGYLYIYMYCNYEYIYIYIIYFYMYIYMVWIYLYIYICFFPKYDWYRHRFIHWGLCLPIRRSYHQIFMVCICFNTKNITCKNIWPLVNHKTYIILYPCLFIRLQGKLRVVYTNPVKNYCGSMPYKPNHWPIYQLSYRCYEDFTS